MIHEPKKLTEALDIVLSEVKKISIHNVVSSAWYCEISTINGQWFEIVTGKNEMDVCIKIEKRFGKETKYQLINMNLCSITHNDLNKRSF